MNILLTSTGRRSYLVDYFKSALAGRGSVYAANSNYTYALSCADDFVITPLIYSDEYIPFLINYCNEKEISVIISLFDIDLPQLSKNIEKFRIHGIQVIVSDFNVIDICNDKWLTYEFLVENAISTPLTYIEKSKAIEAIEENKLQFPVILKPRWGMGSIGIYKADSIEEVDIFYRKIQREIADSYLKYESKSDLDRAVLIQQCIKGREFGIEVINDLDSNYVNTLCKEKIAMRSGETDQAVTLKSNELSELGHKLSTTLGHVSILDVDCLEENSHFYILEMNARFGGQYPFSHLAGANIPKQILNWINGEETDLALCSVEENISCSKDIQPVKLDLN